MDGVRGGAGAGTHTASTYRAPRPPHSKGEASKEHTRHFYAEVVPAMAQAVLERKHPKPAEDVPLANT